MNKIFLIGNLTRDPELRTTPNGFSVCQFGLAVNRPFKGPNGEKQTDFINIVAWRQLGELCARYLSKGRKAAVMGSLQIRQYTDKNGQNRTAAEVVADDVEFLTPRGENPAPQQSDAPPTYAADSFDDTTGFTELDESTLPF